MLEAVEVGELSPSLLAMSAKDHILGFVTDTDICGGEDVRGGRNAG